MYVARRQASSRQITIYMHNRYKMRSFNNWYIYLQVYWTSKRCPIVHQFLSRVRSTHSISNTCVAIFVLTQNPWSMATSVYYASSALTKNCWSLLTWPALAFCRFRYIYSSFHSVSTIQCYVLYFTFNWRAARACYGEASQTSDFRKSRRGTVSIAALTSNFFLFTTRYWNRRNSNSSSASWGVPSEHSFWGTCTYSKQDDKHNKQYYGVVFWNHFW